MNYLAWRTLLRSPKEETAEADWPMAYGAVVPYILLKGLKGPFFSCLGDREGEPLNVCYIEARVQLVLPYLWLK